MPVCETSSPTSVRRHRSWRVGLNLVNRRRHTARKPMADWENRLCDRPPPGLFTSAELDGLPDPVRR
jgi:hypothetical protein